MQILEQEDDFGPRFSFQRTGSFCAIPFSPLLIIDGFTRKSLSYNKLPQEPLMLTVLKLDGSSFDFQVAKTATVGELKEAVEAAFSHLSKKVSWSHVWGHFCLGYDGQKLLTDSDYIGSYGIQDGDQLRFIRHVSINYNTMIKTRAQKQLPAPEEPRISNACEARERNGEKDDGWDEENLKNHQDHDEVNCVTSRCEYKLSRLFRQWFSYRKLNNQETSFEQNNYSNSPRFAYRVLGSLKNIVRCRGNQYNSRTETWKAE